MVKGESTSALTTPSKRLERSSTCTSGTKHHTPHGHYIIVSALPACAHVQVIIRDHSNYQQQLFDDIMAEWQPLTSQDILVISYGGWYPRFVWGSDQACHLLLKAPKGTFRLHPEHLKQLLLSESCPCLESQAQMTSAVGLTVPYWNKRSVIGVLEGISRPHAPPVPKQAGHMAGAGHMESLHATAFRGSPWIRFRVSHLHAQAHSPCVSPTLL